MLKKLIALLLIANYSINAGAIGLNHLEKFVKTVNTGRSDFTQVVTAAPKAGQTARVKTSSGTFEFSRPGQFKFIYKKPFQQSIVADGQTLWLYDNDLNQVTARKQANVLNATPAALIASATDLKALQADFTLTDAPDQDGQEWVSATPKTKDGQVQSVRIGFRQGELATLEILDSFGQTSRMSFTSFQANAVLEPGSFQFKPPAGADVVRQ
jgi:outer membrane lipoprotein carrier protein